MIRVSGLIPVSVLLITCLACNNNSQVDSGIFYKVPSDYSNIRFENRLSENENINIVEYLYYYNGGGVSIGDINNDGFADVFFTSNQNGNKLYLNKGEFLFSDISDDAGIAGMSDWNTGVSMADVNGDGYLDIYVCGVNYKSLKSSNELYINNGDLTFTESAKEYGLDFKGLSTQSLFFDYDNDGDLDMYLLNHSVHSTRSYGSVLLRYQSDAKSGDRLYRNELIPTGVARYVNVTSKANIFNSHIGYGLGVVASDFNLDGWLDLYVANDFQENDYLYLNQGNSKFSQQLERSVGHTSRFSMGTEAADLNNDGYTDILTLDMLPKEESILKSSAGDDPYDIYKFKLRYGYHYQYARNALQLNRGCIVDTLLFSEIACYAGIEATDWSWGSLLADFNNDGYKDIFISNGINKRPNDLDYISFISNDSVQKNYSYKLFAEKMPSGRVSNFLYLNNKNLIFKDVSGDWLGTDKGLSNGCAYGDLDNDGDLDLVINNINEEASVLRNDYADKNANFLKIKLIGEGANKFAVGSKVSVHTSRGLQMQELLPVRGWQSSSDYILNFGIGTNVVDSVLVIWPDSRYQVIRSPKNNTLLIISQEESNLSWSYGREEKPLLNSTNSINFRHTENAFTGFESERLLPHSLALQGPSLSCSDINNDRLEDLFVGGGKNQSGAIYIQKKGGRFVKTPQTHISMDSLTEDTGSFFFDADSDGDKDLIVVSGGQEMEEDKLLKPRLYLNDGRGNYKKAMSQVPEIYLNASCVRANDFDKDGDQDLFIGGRVKAGEYGVTPKSYLLINNGKGVFTDETTSHFTSHELGLVSDAVWTDLTKDGLDDLIVVGEWMKITVLVQSNQHEFIDKSEFWGVKNTEGWWNTITGTDIDKDGDMDFLLGNLGLNSRLRASVDEPIELWVGDIDGNGSTDPILTYYNNHVRYPFVGRDLLIKQVPSLKRKFVSYLDFKSAKLEDVLSAEQLKNFNKRTAVTFNSVWLENTGKTFSVHSFPAEAQFFPVYSIEAVDINKDGHLDIVMAGNQFQVQPELGRYDAGYGLCLLGNGKGNWTPLSIKQSGFYVPGQARDIQVVKDSNGNHIIMVSRNNNSVLAFQSE